MLPVRIVGKYDFRAYTTFALLFVYVSFFFWEIVLTSQGGNPIEYYMPHYALSVCEVGQAPASEILVDSLRAMFMSTGFLQIFVNLFFLWIFGPLVEQFLGMKRFLTLFVLAGLSSYAFSLVLTPYTECEVLYGPNGAIAGLMGAFVFLYPTKKIETFFPLVQKHYELAGLWVAIVYIVIQFVAVGSSPLSGSLAPVWDEIGGFFVGLVYIFIVTLFKPAPKADPFEYLDK